MTENKKEVDFNEYCNKCIFKEQDENDPRSKCYDCLAIPVNENSHKPVFFKED